MNYWQKGMKRTMDIAIGLGGLAGCSPFWIPIAVAIKMDSDGPILFSQKRLGKDGTIFNILKFRTMKYGSSVLIGSDRTVVNLSMDERVTRVGKFLRRTSLDELPQLINVIKGEMSIVGPRPDLPEALDLYTEQERQKLGVKPGITGLSQVSGRNVLNSTKKWALDVEYALNANVFMDLHILFKTIKKVLFQEGIYQEKKNE